MPHTRILRALAQQPWAITPQGRDMVMGVLSFRLEQGAPLSQDQIEARLNGRKERQVAESPGNISVISVRGVISNRMNMLDDISQSGVSAEQLDKQIRAAYNDESVKAIVLDMDTPGGSAAGTPEIADTIRSLRGAQKPIIAQVNALAASAGYWIASACDEIVAVPSAQIGSIGVIMVHEEVSQLLEQEGVNETIISAGKYKAEGNPYQPLDDEARDELQSKVDEYYNLFLSAVAEGRNTDATTVKDKYGQGRTFLANESRKLGMIDRVGTMRETLERLGAKYNDKPERTRASSPSRSPAVKRKRLNLMDEPSSPARVSGHTNEDEVTQ